MAKRLTTRLSAGAALVTGLGMIGVATAVPAHAETSLQYSCTTPVGPQVLDITLDTDAPDTAVVDEEFSVAPSGTVTLNAAIANAMAGAAQWEDVEASIPGVVATISNGTDSVDVDVDLSIPRTTIYEDGAWTDDDTPDLPITGPSQTSSVAAAGSYTISAPTSFDVTFTGYNAAGEEGLLSPIESTCTYVEGSGSLVIDTLEVTEEAPEPPAPEVDDWFQEPGSLPVNGDSFTVTGTATHAGTLTVVLLDSDKNVLQTYTWEVAEGENTRDFAFVDGTDYARIISGDCVDAQGLTGDDVGSGCNVEYRASWAEGDDDQGDGDDQGQGDGDDQGEDQGDGDDAGTTPEIPDVVQTDGFQRVPAGDNGSTAGYLLGGALLAGAGASVVVVARRRRATQG